MATNPWDFKLSEFRLYGAIRGHNWGPNWDTLPYMSNAALSTLGKDMDSRNAIDYTCWKSSGALFDIDWGATSSDCAVLGHHSVQQVVNLPGCKCDFSVSLAKAVTCGAPYAKMPVET